MKLKPMVIGLMALGMMSPAVGSDIAQEIQAIKDRLANLESQLSQEKAKNQQLQNKIAQMSEHQTPDVAHDNGIIKSLEVSGAVEVEAFSTHADGGAQLKEDGSDIEAVTLEIGLDAQITDWVGAHILLLHEEGGNADNQDISVDEVSITLANADVTPFFLTLGRIYVPFGNYESNHVSDPLTLEIGETSDTVVQIGFESGAFSGSVYVFNGDTETNDHSQIEQIGANIAWAMESDTMNLALGLDWINQIGESDTLGSALLNANTLEDKIGGVAVYAVLGLGDWQLIGEYVTATESFQANELSHNGSGAKPEAFNLEVAYGMNLFGRDATIALAYQETDEALALSLPESVYLFTVSVDVFDNTSLSFEWRHENEYDSGDVGIGNDGGVNIVNGSSDESDTLTLQLAVEF